jgi:hypothetical protein
VANKDKPKTGDGKTSKGKKISRFEVKVQRSSGSWNWKETIKLFGKRK